MYVYGICSMYVYSICSIYVYSICSIYVYNICKTPIPLTPTNARDLIDDLVTSPSGSAATVPGHLIYKIH